MRPSGNSSNKCLKTLLPGINNVVLDRFLFSLSRQERKNATPLRRDGKNLGFSP
jgi:hypothetical protein